MWNPKPFLILLALLAPALCLGQTGYGRARRGTTPRSVTPTGAYKDLAGVFHGKLKDLNSKAVVIENEEGQIVSIRRNHKTKFLQDEKEIKPSHIDHDTMVTVEAAQDIDLKPIALSVTVDSVGKKTEEK